MGYMSEFHEEDSDIPPDGAPTQLCFALCFAPIGTCMHDAGNFRAALQFSPVILVLGVHDHER